MKRTLLAVAVALLFYALSDVLLWQRIFERNQLWQYDWPYQTGRGAELLGLVAVGVILLWDDSAAMTFYALATYTLAFSGLCDVLYYVLDGRAIPAELFWLNENRLILFKPVTQFNLLASVGAWLTLWTVVAIIWNRRNLEAI